jgi:acetoacetyl-CoA synthetase
MDSPPTRPDTLAETKAVPRPPSAGPDDLAAVVAGLWDTVLERGPAARDASLLDLKAGVLRVHRLFAEIEKATGVALPITVMFQAPTLDRLIAVVRRGHAPAGEALAELKSGVGAPLFIFPGIGGVALELAELARLMRYEGPVYANQPRGLDGGNPPDRTVAAMAAYQVAIIKAAQPQGPYRLLGYSFGGLVAVEAARLLAQSGDIVDFLGLIEPALPERQWPLPARLEFFWRRLKHHAGTLRSLSKREILSYLASHSETVAGRFRRLSGASAAGPSPYHRDGLPADLAATRTAGWEALQAHELAPYQGKVTLFCSEDGDPIGCDPRLTFPKYFAQCDVVELSGDHAAMLRQPDVRDLADRVSRCLAALASPGDRAPPTAAPESATAKGSSRR